MPQRGDAWTASGSSTIRPACRPRSIRRNTPRWSRCSRRASRNSATASAFVCMDKSITYGELDDMSRDFAAWLQSTGLKRGDRVAVMMPNVLQYPVTTAGVLRAGYVGGERQSALHAARARAPAQRFRRRGDRHPGELRHHAASRCSRTRACKHVVLASMGDLLGFPKGAIVNLVVRKVKKMVPAYSLPQARPVQGGARGRRGKPLKTRRARAR